MLSQEKTDEEIAKNVQKGETSAFGVLVERYEPKLTRYAKKFLFDTEDGKDVVQEVFIKAYINIQSFDVEKKFSPWIYRIAHNEFINTLKKKKREPLLSFDFDTLLPHFISKKTLLEDELHDKEIKSLLETHLSRLPTKYREVLILYYFEQMDYKEIAEILKIPTSTVGIRIRRSKTRLKKLLTEKPII